MNDTELLRRFADENAEDAFADLVRDKINLVYATALRQVGGDAHTAQDVTQSVFFALACHAAKLKRHATLTGWLYTTTRFLAAKAVRRQRRWQHRETKANAMKISNDQTDAAWRDLRPVIDDAMHKLEEKDRVVLLLRFFEGQTYGEVGATLGMTENAARMRIDRALDKLKIRLQRHGITSTAVALSAALAAQPAVAAPAGLAATVTSGALGCTVAGTLTGIAGGAAALLNFMSTSKMIISGVGAVAIFSVGAYLGVHSSLAQNPTATDHVATESRAEFAHLRAETGALREQLAQLRTKQRADNPSAGALAGGGKPDILAASDKWRLLAELQKKKLVQMRITFVDGAGTLNAAVVPLFDLTPDEHAALSRIVDVTREKIEALERNNATVSRQSDGNIVIKVNSFPETGGPVYDELMRGIAETLGPDRNAAFLTLCADQVEKALGAFGATQRIVTITSQPDSPHSRYLARDERVSPGSNSSESSNYRDREDLLNRVGTITKLLPKNF